jgi:hypothetical protein
MGGVRTLLALHLADGASHADENAAHDRLAEFPRQRLARQHLLIDRELEFLDEGPEPDFQRYRRRFVAGARFAQKPQAANQLGRGLTQMRLVEVSRIVGVK